MRWLSSPMPVSVGPEVCFSDVEAKRAYLNMILNPPPSMPTPATIRPYDRPDAAQIIQSLAARAMGHRSSMSAAMSSGNFGNVVSPQDSGRTPPNSAGINGFKMPLNPSFSFGGSAGGSRNNSQPQRMGSFGSHQRAGSASSAWNRQSLSGALGFGANPSLGAARLPTHSEQSSGGPTSRSTSSSGSNDPVVVVDSSTQLKSTSSSLRGSLPKGRRESVSADKALREVEKALQSVEAQG